MNSITLDFSCSVDSETLHEYLSKELVFPGYYRYNFDTFWDGLSDAAQSSVPEALIIKNLSALERLLPEDARKLKDCLDAFATQFSYQMVTYAS